MAPAQPPFPTPWKFWFQPVAGSQTSTLISESLVGLMVAATRQNSGRSAKGFAPSRLACPSLGAENWPAGTTRAMVMVVSGNASDARLSHEAANAGTAARQASAPIALFIVGFFTVGIFPRASKSSSVYTCGEASLPPGYFFCCGRGSEA